LAFRIQPVKAQQWYYNFEITVSPESPTTLDEINVTVGFEISNMNENVTFGSVSQTGNGFSVDIDIYVPLILLPTIIYVTQTYSLGKLPAGSYNFTAAVTVSGFGFGFSQYSKSFEVSHGVIIVPDDYATIQAAINAANDGDTVYVKAGTYYENLVVNKTLSLVGEDAANTTIDLGNSSGSALVYIDASWVNVTGFTIRNGANYGFSGICLGNASNCLISGNNITNNDVGICFAPSSYGNSSSNTIVGNNITNNVDGVMLGNGVGFAENNSVVGNNITNNSDGVYFWSSSDNIIVGNNISANDDGFFSYLSYSNSIVENDITNCSQGIDLEYRSFTNSIVANNITANLDGVFVGGYEVHGNVFYHNNFVGNTQQANITYDVSNQIWWGNVWDNGYPDGGNYWSDYTGTDLYNGPGQNMTGSDGIGDTAYVIETSNIDNYPLMSLWASPDIAVTTLTSSKTVIAQGYTSSVNLTFENLGNRIEAFNATVCVNSTCIYSEQTMLAMTNYTISFGWNTTGFAYGNYTITASAEFDPSENATTNNCTCSVIVTILGDVNGDLKVNMRDIALVARAFGSYGPDYIYPGSPPSTNWNPNADIDSDGTVNMRDVALVARNFGQHYP